MSAAIFVYFPLHVFLDSSFILPLVLALSAQCLCFVDRALSVTLGFPGVSVCAGCAVDCDRDGTRQQGKGREGGSERKAAKWREGRFLECVVNGCVERGP